METKHPSRMAAENTAYDQGVLAFKAGVDRLLNPYDVAEIHRAWDDGWLAASATKKAKDAARGLAKMGERVAKERDKKPEPEEIAPLSEVDPQTRATWDEVCALRDQFDRIEDQWREDEANGTDSAIGQALVSWVAHHLPGFAVGLGVGAMLGYVVSRILLAMLAV